MIALAPASSARASHLAFALLCLPAQRRRDALIFFRFCRAVDDIADEGEAPASERERELEAWRHAIESGRLPDELEDVVTRNAIDRSLLAEIVRGCAQDVGPVRFRTFEELECYCWRVACAVGLVSIRIFGCRDPHSVAYAEHLGHALQLTNILRDVGDDASLGRIYIPAEEMERFQVGEGEILGRCPGRGFVPLLRSVAGRARSRFLAAVPPAPDRRALLPSEIMRSLYLHILTRLEAEDFPVFERRIRLGGAEKFVIAFRTIFWR